MNETCVNCGIKSLEIDLIYDVPNNKYFHNQACADKFNIKVLDLKHLFRP